MTINIEGRAMTPVERRRVLIALCRRRIRAGTGSSRAFLMRRTAMHSWPDLRPVLKKIPWAIIGGVATRAYMPERVTHDLDILIHAQNAPTVRQRLETAEYTWVAALAIPGFTYRSSEGIEVDVVLSDAPWVTEALTHPQFDLAGYPILALPYLVLLKLASSRTQDIADLSRMLGLANENTLTQVRTVVACYAPGETEDVESLIYLGKLEISG
ncbi:MAG: hypothetical protein JXA33_04350 [Anaerolineae bacterium]|nr:hypothetical protein [Anaerolineae bacterium]